jgi:Ni,Fe-hydrogenase I cytochrome b subunit
VELLMSTLLVVIVIASVMLSYIVGTGASVILRIFLFHAGVRLPHWVDILTWVVMAWILGWLLGRWRRGPTWREMATGCLLFVAGDMFLGAAVPQSGTVEGALLIGGLVAATIFVAALVASRRRRRPIADDV